MDLDLNMTLYELLPSGEYLKLFEPAYEFRASYLHDPVNRRLLHFFFQAEDGIRDLTVTGVQTCALPISPEVGDASHIDPRGDGKDRRARGTGTQRRHRGVRGGERDECEPGRPSRL